MQHTHKINDRDPYFEIDAVTRKIVNKSSSKVSIIQYDHNSERFTFVLPRYIEEHDMSEVTKAEVHYMSGKTKTPGIYTMTDLAISPEDDDKVVCTWLLSQNVTMETGAISFVLRLSCIGEDGSIEYAWSTAIFTGISVAEGIFNAEAIVEQYADVLEQWKEELQNGTGGEGGSITIDDAMSDTSKNAVQNKVVKAYVDEKLLTKVGAHMSGVHYNVGDVAVADVRSRTEDGNEVIATALVVCVKEHTSEDVVIDSSIENWFITPVSASLDALGNEIHKYYASKSEIGVIEKALLEIEAMADSLIGGDAE